MTTYFSPCNFTPPGKWLCQSVAKNECPATWHTPPRASKTRRTWFLVQKSTILYILLSGGQRGPRLPLPPFPNESIHQSLRRVLQKNLFGLFFPFFRVPRTPRAARLPRITEAQTANPFLVRQYAGRVPFIICHPLIPKGLISVDGLGGV